MTEHSAQWRDGLVAARAWLQRVEPYPERNGDHFRELREILDRALAAPTDQASDEPHHYSRGYPISQAEHEWDAAAVQPVEAPTGERWKPSCGAVEPDCAQFGRPMEYDPSCCRWPKSCSADICTLPRGHDGPLHHDAATGRTWPGPVSQSEAPTGGTTE